MTNIIFLFAGLVFTSGIFIMLTNDNYIRKILGLGIMQSSVLIFYIALGKVKGGVLPIDICDGVNKCNYIFSSPLPHVLMLTAIVVGFSTMSVGLALIYKIHKEYGSIVESQLCQNKY